jgi:hypothetical protein
MVMRLLWSYRLSAFLTHQVGTGQDNEIAPTAVCVGGTYIMYFTYRLSRSPSHDVWIAQDTVIAGLLQHVLPDRITGFFGLFHCPVL